MYGTTVIASPQRKSDNYIVFSIGNESKADAIPIFASAEEGKTFMIQHNVKYLEIKVLIRFTI